MGVWAEPSLIHTLRCLWSQFPRKWGADTPLWVCTYSGGCTHSLERWVAGWRGDWSCYCSRIPQSAPEGLFLFEKILLFNPAIPYKEGPVLSHSSPLQLDQDCPGQGPTQPNSQLFPASAHVLCMFTTSFLLPSLNFSLTVYLKIKF